MRDQSRSNKEPKRVTAPGAAQEQAVVRDTPNLAARLQTLAEPGAVVIASSTRTLIGGLFEYRDLGTERRAPHPPALFLFASSPGQCALPKHQLERAAGFQREDTVDQRLDKLEAVLALGTNDLSEAVPLLADLLSIPTGDRYPPLNLTPQRRKEKTLHAQLMQVEGLATRR